MADNDTLWLQAAGADPAISYSALGARKLIEATLSEGVIAAPHLVVSERAAGANLSVDVAPGQIAITGDDVAGQGRYLAQLPSVVNVAVATGPGGGNSRIDLVVARMYDKLVTGAAYGLTIEVIGGTASGSPVPPAVPNGAAPLAEVRMNATDTSVLGARITDRRSTAGPQPFGPRRTWSPIWKGSVTDPVLGNGTLTGRFREIGKTLVFTIDLAIGSTTTLGSGLWTFSLPPGRTVVGTQYVEAILLLSGTTLLGRGQVTGGGIYVLAQDNSPATINLQYVTGAIPAAWVAGTTMNISGEVELV